MKNIVILTGAGISADSGLSTFRDQDGIWSKYDIDDVATPEAFERNPHLVHEFYNARRAGLIGTKPNAAHRALSRLENEHPGTVLIVTQNVDNLHEKTGSQNLIHMHGELAKIRCQSCGLITKWGTDLEADINCPTCAEPGGLRPHIVWFGEMPHQMTEIGEAIGACDLFLSIGTSGNVYPAAGFVMEARNAHAHTVELNLEPSEGESYFHEKIYGPASEVVSRYIDTLLET
jgi:NAD-dependent deacetylase